MMAVVFSRINIKVENSITKNVGRMNLPTFWSGWRDLNSRPLEPHWPGLRPALLKASLQHHFTGNYTLNVGILRFAQAKCLPFGAILFTLNRML